MHGVFNATLSCSSNCAVCSFLPKSSEMAKSAMKNKMKNKKVKKAMAKPKGKPQGVQEDAKKAAEAQQAALKEKVIKSLVASGNKRR